MILKQTDLPNPIKDQGCLFIACLFPAQDLTGYELSHKEVDCLWLESIDSGFIIVEKYKDKEGKQRTAYKVKSTTKIMNLALSKCGSDFEFKEIGTFNAGVINWYSWGNYPEYRIICPYLIQKVIVNNDEGGYHFRNVDNAGKITNDPETRPYTELGTKYSILYFLKEDD